MDELEERLAKTIAQKMAGCNWDEMTDQEWVEASQEAARAVLCVVAESQRLAG